MKPKQACTPSQKKRVQSSFPSILRGVLKNVFPYISTPPSSSYKPFNGSRYQTLVYESEYVVPEESNIQKNSESDGTLSRFEDIQPITWTKSSLIQ